MFSEFCCPNLCFQARKSKLDRRDFQRRRRLERLIEPGKQVAVDKQLLPQQGDQIGQGPAKGSSQLQVVEQEQGDQGSPDLNPQGIGAGTHKSFDPQVLFEGAKEDFDLPALAIDLGHRGGAEAEVMGQQYQRFSFSETFTTMRRRYEGLRYQWLPKWMI